MRRPIFCRGNGVGITQPPAATGSIVFDSTLNIVFDGNSLVAGQGGAQNIPRCMAMTAPIATSTSVGFLPAPTVVSSPPTIYQSSKGVRLTNLGVNGQTWRQMNGLDVGSSADVDGAFDATKTNILLAWEWTNAICNTKRTVAQVIQDATDYATARRAAHPWAKIFTGTALPRMDSSTDQALVDSENALLDQVNTYLRTNYAAMGFDGIFDVRQAGTYYDMQGDYTIAHFNTMASDPNTYWASNDTSGQHIHQNSNGYWYIVQTAIMPMLMAA